MKKLIILSLLVGIVMVSIGGYAWNKTIWKWNTDCMIEYINNHYPNGCTYLINWDSHHIDKCWIWNEFMIETNKIKGCVVGDSPISYIFNTPYCYTVLFFENL